MKFKNPKFVLIAILLLLIVSLSWKLIEGNDGRAHTSSNSLRGIVSSPNKKMMIKKSIERYGAENTFATLKRDLKQENVMAHSIMHMFGELLYDKEGMDGVLICDETFGFGCFHGFFSPALASQGVNAVSITQELCIKEFGKGGLGCQHGIGHGLMEYFTVSRIDDALKTCLKVDWKGKFLGCSDGVFMEYNFPTGINPDGSSTTVRREYSEEKTYAPCYSVAERFAQSCFYNLPQWWASVFNHDFSKLGALCQNVYNQKYREVCFLGIGNIIPPLVDFVIDTAKEKCNSMPNEQSRTQCSTGGAWGFFAEGERYRRTYLNMCEGLSVEDRQYCINNSNLYEFALKK